MDEIWKDIIGYEGIYQCSCNGSIRRFKNDKNINRIKDWTTKNGYKMFCVSVNNVRKFFYTHRIIAELFIDNKGNKRCINHINGIKTDNRIDNLEWCTYSENHIHAYNNGLMRKGELSSISKLKQSQVDDIRRKYIPYVYSQFKLAKEYGVSRSCIMDIIKIKNWK